MQFRSEKVRSAAQLFQTVGFSEARQVLSEFLSNNPPAPARAEALALLLRIDVERDDPAENERIYRRALDLKAMPVLSLAALYHLGIVCTLCEDVDSAEYCYQKFRRECTDDKEKRWGDYGMAAVAYNRKDSEKALALLKLLESICKNEPDFECLLFLLKGNCLRSLSRYQPALDTYGNAQKLLPHVKTFYLKNWVFFGLATTYARLRNETTAKTLFEIVLSLTHPVDFKRLYRIAQDELARLQLCVEVLFDPVRGDIVSNRGCLTLRGKPILISILRFLGEHWPETCSKESLYCWVWKGEYHPLRHDGLLYSHIQRLRQILSADKNLRDFILTTQEGYQLNPDIRVRLKERSPLLCQENSHENNKMDLDSSL